MKEQIIKKMINEVVEAAKTKTLIMLEYKVVNIHSGNVYVERENIEDIHLVSYLEERIAEECYDFRVLAW